MWNAVLRIMEPMATVVLLAMRGEEREGCAVSSGEQVRVRILGEIGSRFPTLGHQGSGSF